MGPTVKDTIQAHRKESSKDLAARLNRMGLKDSEGNPFTLETVGEVRKALKASKQERPAVVDSPHYDAPYQPQRSDHEATADATQPPISYPLDSETVAVLQEVVAWWKTRKDPPEITHTTITPQVSYRPNFPGPKDNTGIRVNRRLLRAAKEKAKTAEEARKLGGGGLSPLIERLLWQYLDYDQKYLEPIDD